MVWIWLWGSIAGAADGLIWSWDESKPVRYHVETEVETPATHFWYGLREQEVRATRQVLNLSVTCVGSPAGKRWEIDCSIDSVQIRGLGVPGEEEALRTVMDQSMALLDGKSIQIIMGAEGRIKKLELKGIDVVDSRVGAIAENLRQMIRRAFAPMDVQLPKEGNDKDKAWRQKGSPLAVSLFGDQGTSGGVVMKREVVEVAGSSVRLVMSARGSMALGAAMEAGTTPILRINSKGRSSFNTDRGIVDWAEVRTKSAYGTSNLDALSGLPPSSFTSKVSRILPDGTQLFPDR
jgi:hypothetical protein